MKANLKKLFFWSSLGGIAIGAAVTVAHRTKRTKPAPLSCRKIPLGCKGLALWTERFEVEVNGERRFAHDHYSLQPTQFKVWSVLDLTQQHGPGRPGPEGAAIYHITQMRIYETRPGADEPEPGVLQERFYGVVTVIDDSGRSCGSNSIARGGILEVKKCYVGGSSNGVESGEVHRSLGRILNYRFELPST